MKKVLDDILTVRPGNEDKIFYEVPDKIVTTSGRSVRPVFNSDGVSVGLVIRSV